VNGARLFSCVAAFAAVGCLWLFPIPEEKAQPSSSGTGMGGATGMGGTTAATGGAAGTSGMTENDAGCTVNEDCGDPIVINKICRAHQCVTWLTPECQVTLGNWSDPNAFVFGAYAVESLLDPKNSPFIYNYDLAINELNKKGGLPDRQGTKHPLAAIVCDNPDKAARPATNPDFLSASLHHLVDDLGVPAIVADLLPDQLEKALQITHRDENKSIFLLSPSAANKKLNGLVDDGLVWNMLGPPGDLAAGYSDLVRRIENVVRASDAGTTSLRVAVVLKDDPTAPDHDISSERYEAVKAKLFFNGLPATSQSEETFREFHIDATKSGGAPLEVGDAVNAFLPHIVISMTDADFTRVDSTNIQNDGVVHGMITRVDGRSAPPAWIRHEYPFFIFSPGNAGSVGDFNALLMSPVVLTTPWLYQRFLGITVAGADDRDILKEYLKRLRASQMAAVEGLENYYDSIYYLAYAVYAAYMAAVDPTSIDGRKIASGMIQLNGGIPEKVGPGPIASVEIEKVFQDLKTGSILLSGASGSKFDVSTGARINKAGLYCFQKINTAFVAQMPAEIFDPDSVSAQKWTLLLPEVAPGMGPCGLAQ
jgi:hypothetical protein